MLVTLQETRPCEKKPVLSADSLPVGASDFSGIGISPKKRQLLWPTRDFKNQFLLDTEVYRLVIGGNVASITMSGGSTLGGIKVLSSFKLKLEDVFTRVLRAETGNSELRDSIKKNEEGRERLKLGMEHVDQKIDNAKNMDAMLDVSMRNNRNADRSLALALREQEILFNITRDRIDREATDRREREEKYKARLKGGLGEIWAKHPKFLMLEEKVREEQAIAARFQILKQPPMINENNVALRMKLERLKDLETKLINSVDGASLMLQNVNDKDHSLLPVQSEGEEEFTKAPAYANCTVAVKGSILVENIHDSGIETSYDAGDETTNLDVEVGLAGEASQGGARCLTPSKQPHSIETVNGRNTISFNRAVPFTTGLISVPPLMSKTSHSTPQTVSRISLKSLTCFQNITPITKSHVNNSMCTPTSKDNLMQSSIPSRQAFGKRSLLPSVGAKRKIGDSYDTMTLVRSGPMKGAPLKVPKSDASLLPAVNDTPTKKCVNVNPSISPINNAPSDPDAQMEIVNRSRSKIFTATGGAKSSSPVGEPSGGCFYSSGDSTIAKLTIKGDSKNSPKFIEFQDVSCEKKKAEDKAAGGNSSTVKADGNPFDFNFGTASEGTFTFGGPSMFDATGFGEVEF